jgi:hypothetical protein
MNISKSPALILGLAAAALCSGACSTAKYRIVDPKDTRVVQSVEAKAPGGDTFVLVVYYGRQKTPIINASGDSSALVEATAAAGRRAVAVALKAAGK